MKKSSRIIIIAVTMTTLTTIAIRSLGLVFSISGVSAPDHERRSIKLVTPLRAGAKPIIRRRGPTAAGAKFFNTAHADLFEKNPPVIHVSDKIINYRGGKVGIIIVMKFCNFIKFFRQTRPIILEELLTFLLG